ncbi:ABC transporter permease subunit [soil metagenome]
MSRGPEPGRRARPIHIALLLAPALLAIIALFGGGLADALLQSFGWLPAAGLRELSFAAYARVLGDADFLYSLLLTGYIAGTSTIIATLLAIALALRLRKGARRLLSILQLPLVVPHLLAAVGIGLLLAQSGLLARLAAAFGLIAEPREFPPLVHDPYAVGIILTYIWKEVPFITLIALALLERTAQDREQAARTLGATRWQSVRHVTLPAIMPGILAAAFLVFAFAFGAFEVPLLLGETWPQTLPVLAWNEYRSIDLSDRPAAMAITVLIALVTGLVAALLLRVRIGDIPH